VLSCAELRLSKHFNIFDLKHIKKIPSTHYNTTNLRLPIHHNMLPRAIRTDGLETTFDLGFKCQYKEVEKKYLKKKQSATDATTSRCKDEPDEFSTPETIEDDDILFLCEEVYREDFLKFFKLENFEDEIVNKKTEKLFKACSRNALFSSLITKIKIQIGVSSADDECAFMQLFSYPFFNLTHECIKEYLLNGAINEGLSATIEDNVTLFFKQ